MIMTEKETVMERLKEVIDPELQLDIVSLGLIYDVVLESGKAKVTMSLTSPVCPYGPQLIEDVRQTTSKVEGVEEVEVEITFDPPWGPDKMSEEARIALGM